MVPSHHRFTYTHWMSIVRVGDFESGDLSGWREEVFRGKTNYMIVRNEGRNALIARSSASASGLIKDVWIDLKKTPYLNWSWKTENTLTDLNELTKKGDDYCARVYVIFKHPFFWKTLSLTYVWSSNQPVNTAWPNAYTSNAMTVAVQSGSTNVGRWVSEKRHVASDYRRWFGKKLMVAESIALMTDTDNSGQSATAYYGNIFFSAE
jgi:hypothetical protein